MATTQFKGGKGLQPCWDPTSENRTQLLMIDISRAQFNAKTDEEDPTYVELPSEMGTAPGTCGFLRRHMYGTRRAAEGWTDECSTSMTDAGFIQGIASPCVFHHPTRNIVCSVHGDDFTAAGPKPELDWFEATLRKSYEFTVGGRLGPGPTDDKETIVLGRVIRWTDDGIEYEADPRQVEALISELQLVGEAVKGVLTPGVKVLSHQVQSETVLPESEHTRFRGLAARAKIRVADHPDIVYSAEEICRRMAKPAELATQALKRLGRYLKKHLRMVFSFPSQTASSIEVYSDTDWAGSVRTRKSTSGSCMIIGSHVIKFW